MKSEEPDHTAQLGVEEVKTCYHINTIIDHSEPGRDQDSQLTWEMEFIWLLSQKAFQRVFSGETSNKSTLHGL